VTSESSVAKNCMNLFKNAQKCSNLSKTAQILVKKLKEMAFIRVYS
jgi:hypothetical protein